MAKDDGELWREVAGSVTPLKGKAVPPSPSPPAAGPPRKTKTKATQTKSPPVPVKKTQFPRQKLPANLDADGYGGISAADARRLKSGDTDIMARLDLHGMTLAEAQSAFAGFIKTHACNRTKTVLVITGKGKKGHGVIREHLPRWCGEADIAPLVIAFCHAMPRDGGAGAFYLRLRGRQKQ